MSDPIYTAWDTETDLIGINSVVPDLICSSFYDLKTEKTGLRHWSPKDEHADTLHNVFSKGHVVGHNIGGFDLPVAVKYDPTLLPIIWEALAEGRIHCTMLREMLLNLATTGSIDSVAVEGSDRQMSYSLADLALKYLGEDIQAEKEDEDSARMNYSMVKDKPLSEWPEEFQTYAIKDAELTGRVFLCQEVKRNQIIEERGFDPLKVEGFRVRVAFALALMTAQGNYLDKDEVLAVTKEYQEKYNDPELVEPLIKAGIVIPAQPETPNKRGTKDHQIDCVGHKDNPNYKKGKMIKDCDCPVKMNKAQPEKGSDNGLFDYLWEAAKNNEALKLWPAPKLLEDLTEDGLKDAVMDGKRLDQDKVKALLIEQGLAEEKAGARPKGWGLKVDKEWLATYASLDPVTEKYAERKRVQKIVTSYLPRLYWAEGRDSCPDTLEGCQDRLEGKVPAGYMHGPYSPLKETGRCSSRAATKGKGRNAILLYPSMNVQQVDPRIRSIVVPEGYLEYLKATGREDFDVDLTEYTGNVIFSLDYNAMELGTLAQKCIDLFGYSKLGELINNNVDTHAFLGAQIAHELDKYFASACDTNDKDEIAANFMSLKKEKSPCTSPHFLDTKPPQSFMLGVDKYGDLGDGATWSLYYAHYRTFAKPTGLGYPGGLGPATFITYAKGMFGFTIDLDMAKLLRELWKTALPEMSEYLEHVNKGTDDTWSEPDYEEQEDGTYKKRPWHCYTTPLGMHRARCSYTAAANGMGLQSPSAEGALSALCETMQECTTGSLAGKLYPSMFIHDELVGECPWKGAETTEWLDQMGKIMVKNMMKITPDVASRVEPALMFRWSKKADPVYDEAGVLVPWVPEKKEEE